ncbi:MAG: TonB-dependent receptor [Tannerellaceae bacterium]|nr:TonB-dependent receptor [Tannerellaceae bacterium]
MLITLLSAHTAYAQERTVRGSVVDEFNDPVVGATVLVRGTATGTITDMDGAFTINAKNGDILVVSYVGYLEQAVTIDGNAERRIVLKEDTQLLDEIVVVGYGTRKKSDVTGAMISLSEKDLKTRPISNAFEAMQGKAAGVDITSNERPGELGNINIRGIRSLSASNTPLYVVDGIPLMSASGIETINPSDIESIDVLKDASATAIYGSRGDNGVILVTTKKGKEGKYVVDYAGSVTFETIQDRTEMMDAGEYLEWRRWAYYYADPAKYPRGDQPTSENDYQIFLGANDPYAWANIQKGWSGGSWDGSKVQTTDWVDMVTRTGATHEHTLSVSGGSDKMRAYASFGYLNNEGTMYGQDYERYTAKASLDINPNKWIDLGATITTTWSDQQYGQSNTGGQVSGPGSIYAAANNNFPYAVPFDDAGNRITYPGGDDMVKTAVDEWKYTDNQRQIFRALGSFYAQLNIYDGLKYRFNFGPDFRHRRNGIYIDEMSVNRNGSPNFVSLENRRDFSWTLDNLVYYDKEFGNHKIGATLLQTASAWNYESSYMRALGIPLASQKWNALNATNVTSLDSWDSSFQERQLMSYMARLNYGFSEKYIATVSGRWDGASQLADGHKWSFFPSAALAWRMDQEDFIKPLDWISQLKIRLGVGVTGNAAVDPYQTKGEIQSLVYPYGSSLTSGYVTSEPTAGDELAMANRQLGWEKTTQYNLGLDYSFLNGRISGIIDAYTSHTADLLMRMNIPSLTGYTSTYANIGETKNIGVDITLNTLNIKTKNFTWETGVNMAWQKDEIVSLANGKEDDIANTWFIGYPVGYTLDGDAHPGVVYNYESAGLWQEEDRAEMEKFNANGHAFQVGMARPVDQNGDYRIDPNDDRKIIGHTRPRWTGGMTNTFTYKGIELSVFLYGRLDYTVNTNGEWQGGRYVQRSISYWNENNKNADYQKPIYNVAGGDPYYNILGYRSGSFIKIRNISLGYIFPRNMIKNLGVESLKIYLQAKNPGMLMSDIDWLDMDLGGSTWNRGFTFGLNVGF